MAPSFVWLTVIDNALATLILFDVAVIVNEYVVLLLRFPTPLVVIAPVDVFKLVFGCKEPEVTA